MKDKRFRRGSRKYFRNKGLFNVLILTVLLLVSFGTGSAEDGTTQQEDISGQQGIELEEETAVVPTAVTVQVYIGDGGQIQENGDTMPVVPESLQNSSNNGDNPDAVSLQTPETAPVKKFLQSKPGPDPNYKGVSISDNEGKALSSLTTEAGPKNIQTVENLGRPAGVQAKAQHVKNSLKDTGSPELKELEEKLQMRKANFRKELAERRAEKAMTEGQSGK